MYSSFACLNTSTCFTGLVKICFVNLYRLTCVNGYLENSYIVMSDRAIIVIFINNNNVALEYNNIHLLNTMYRDKIY